MVWGTFLEKNFPSSNGHLLDGQQNGKNGKMLKSRLKKSAPECPFECGAGGVKAKRAMPKCQGHEFEWGFPKWVGETVYVQVLSS